MSDFTLVSSIYHKGVEVASLSRDLVSTLEDDWDVAAIYSARELHGDVIHLLYPEED